jgi:hypothetical protein
MRKAAAIVWAAAVMLVYAGNAHAQGATPLVTYVSSQPPEGTAGSIIVSPGGQVSIKWEISSSSAGVYDLEVGGSGTMGSGAVIIDKTSFNSGSDVPVTTDFSSTQLGTASTGTYTVYLIAVENSGGGTSNGSVSVVVETQPGVVDLTIGRGDSELFLSWPPPTATNLSYYNLYYVASSTPPATQEDYGAPIDIGNPLNSSGNLVQYTLTGLSNGTEYWLAVTAVDAQGVEGPFPPNAISGIPTVSEGFSELSNDAGGCFIATAAWGDYNHPLVKNLRAFRDRVLLNSSVGREFVRGYYAASPPLARWLSRRPVARAAVRIGLTPISWLAGAEAGRPGVVSAPALLMLVSALALLARRRRGVTR